MGSSFAGGRRCRRPGRWGEGVSTLVVVLDRPRSCAMPPSTREELRSAESPLLQLRPLSSPSSSPSPPLSFPLPLPHDRAPLLSITPDVLAHQHLRLDVASDAHGRARVGLACGRCESVVMLSHWLSWAGMGWPGGGREEVPWAMSRSIGRRWRGFRGLLV